MKTTQTSAWRDYEAGKEYKRRIGLYETVRRNERFYRGDQWYGTNADLPRPVFNVVRRITDYLVGSVLSGDLTIQYADEQLPFVSSTPTRELIESGIQMLNRNAAYRWERNHMKALSQNALLNAAISGDAVFYCWWDSAHKNGQPFLGEIHTDLIENTDLFVSDVNKRDLQTQDYVMIAGRATVTSLRREAKEQGLSREEIDSIIGDSAMDARSSDMEAHELSGSEKATYLIRFFREDGEVVFEKSTRTCLLKRVHTGLRLYPIAYFNWMPTKGSFHGTAPVSDLIANQKYINTAYAMVMKHMYGTAFSKVIYDKSRIPDWSNEVGQAIATVGGGNVADAVSVLGTGQMQDGYLDLINNVIENTKSMMGATDSALGDERANNTSAILALQQASQVALRQVSTAFCCCIGQLATIWADMLCTYCHPEQYLITAKDGSLHAERPDYRLLKSELIRAVAKISMVDRYTPSATVTLLDKLLEAKEITPEDYVELLPEGTLYDRSALLCKIQSKGTVKNE